MLYVYYCLIFQGIYIVFGIINNGGPMFFKIKKFIFKAVILLLLTCLSSSLYAFNEASQLNINASNASTTQQNITETSPVFKKSRNAVYNLISSYEYFISPLVGTMAAGGVCGLWCAIAGGAAGIIDEVSVYFGFTDKRYLTWGIFGLATSHSISKSHVSDAAGIAVGILLPTGIINKHKEYIIPSILAITGNEVAGIPGMVVGGLAGVIDEVRIRHGYSSEHEYSLDAIGTALTDLLGWFDPVTSKYIGMMLGSTAADYEEKISANFLTPVKTINDLYATYNKFIPKKQLDKHVEKQALTLIGSQFSAQYLSSKLMEHQRDTMLDFARLDRHADLALNKFKTSTIKFAVFLFPYAVGQAVSSSIDAYFCKKLQYALKNQINSELFSGETALRLSHNDNTSVLVDSFKDDVNIMVDSGSNMMTGAIGSSVRGAYGIGIIIISSPSTLVYTALYNKASSFISEYLSAQHRNSEEKIKNLDSELADIIKYDTKNIRTIAERDGIDATKRKTQQLISDIDDQAEIQKLWEITRDVWHSISRTADYMFSCYLSGSEITKGKVSFENRGKIQTAGMQVLGLLSWSTHNTQNISSINESLDRVAILEGIIHAKPSNDDLILRSVYNGNQLILQDLEIGIDDKILVTTKDIKLDMGKTYAITGGAGCGKTSLLSKIKGIKENKIFGKGRIYYPSINGDMPKIVMLGQQDYFPLKSSLLDVIFYPDKTPTDTVKQEEISILLREIDLGDFTNKDNGTTSLNSIKNWHTAISGGQKKKVMIVSALIKKPDILILDEIFNELDPESKITTQKMLRKYLPNALILVVDHYAQNNNYDSFYDYELNLANKSISLKGVKIQQQLQ